MFLLSVINGFILCMIQIFAGHRLAARHGTTVFFFVVFIIIEFVLISALARQPKANKELYFEVSHFQQNKKSIIFILHQFDMLFFDCFAFFSISSMFLNIKCWTIFLLLDTISSICPDSERSHQHLLDSQAFTSYVDPIRRLDGFRWDFSHYALSSISITKPIIDLGFLIYGFYGFWHSSQRFINDTQRLLSGSTSSLISS